MNETAQSIADSQEVKDAIANLIGTVLLAADSPTPVVGGDGFHQAIEQAIVQYLEGVVETDSCDEIEDYGCPPAIVQLHDIQITGE